MGADAARSAKAMSPPRQARRRGSVYLFTAVFSLAQLHAESVAEVRLHPRRGKGGWGQSRVRHAASFNVTAMPRPGRASALRVDSFVDPDRRC